MIGVNNSPKHNYELLLSKTRAIIHGKKDVDTARILKDNKELTKHLWYTHHYYLRDKTTRDWVYFQLPTKIRQELVFDLCPLNRITVSASLETWEKLYRHFQVTGTPVPMPDKLRATMPLLFAFYSIKETKQANNPTTIRAAHTFTFHIQGCNLALINKLKENRNFHISEKEIVHAMEGLSQLHFSEIVQKKIASQGGDVEKINKTLLELYQHMRATGLGAVAAQEFLPLAMTTDIVITMRYGALMSAWSDIRSSSEELNSIIKTMLTTANLEYGVYDESI